MTEKGNIWEKGFTQIPNVILDILPHFLDTKSGLIIVIIRQTFGYSNRPCHEMTTSFFEKATGKKKRHILIKLAELQSEKIIINYKDEKNQKNVWGLNLNYSQWETPKGALSCTQKRKGVENSKRGALYDTPKGALSCTKGVHYTTPKKENIKNKNILNKEPQNDIQVFIKIIDDNIYINKSKKILNEKLLKQDFYNSFDYANNDNYFNLISELVKMGYSFRADG